MGSKVGETQGGHALVSVLVAAYNSSRTIVATVESVLAQSWPALEVVVVDDGSTDDTLARLSPFRDRVRVIHKPNGGVATNRNAGCAAATGEFIALIDGDDLCHPDRIAIQASVLARHPEVVLCSTDFTAFDEGGPLSASHGAAYYSAIAGAPQGLDTFYPRRERLDLPAGEWPRLNAPLAVDVGVGRVYPELAFGNFVHPPAVMFRKGVLELAGLSDAKLRYTSEWEWFVRMARHGEFAHVHRALLDYRISPMQASATGASGGRAAVEIVETLDKILSADPVLFETHPFRIRDSLRDFCFDAAYQAADRQRGVAARMLMRSLANGGGSIPALKTAVRIALPPAITRAVRNARSRVQP